MACRTASSGVELRSFPPAGGWGWVRREQRELVGPFYVGYGLPMHIRQEREGDCSAIADVTVQAFANVAHSDHTEPDIIKRLREAGDLLVSLVAIDGDHLLGHVAFSPIMINRQHCKWYGLGPVSVRPDRHGQGIGSALIRAGLAELSSLDAGGCVVLGDPAYYRRFGFEQDDRLLYEGAPPEYFMRLTLNAQHVPSGSVTYAPGFTG